MAVPIPTAAVPTAAAVPHNTEVLIQIEAADMVRVGVLNTGVPIRRVRPDMAAAARLNMAPPTMTVAVGMGRVVRLNMEVPIPKARVVTAAAVPRNMALRTTIGAAVMEPVDLLNMEAPIPHAAAEAQVPAAILNMAGAPISTIAAPVAMIRTAAISTTEVILNTIAAVRTRTEPPATAPALRAIMEVIPRAPTRITRAVQANRASSIRIEAIQAITTPAAVPARAHPGRLIPAAGLMTSEVQAVLLPNLEAIPPKARQAIRVRIRTAAERAVLERAHPANRAMTQTVPFTQVIHPA